MQHDVPADQAIVASVLAAANQIGRLLESSTEEPAATLELACQLLAEATTAELAVIRDCRPDRSSHFVAGWAKTAILESNHVVLEVRDPENFTEPVLVRELADMPIRTPPRTTVKAWQKHLPVPPVNLFCPIRSGGHMHGFLCLVGDPNVAWSETVMNAVGLAASVISQYQLRIWAEESSLRRLSLAQFLTTASRQLFDVRPGEEATGVAAVLPELADLIVAESISVWTLNRSKGRGERLCDWHRTKPTFDRPQVVSHNDSPVDVANLGTILELQFPQSDDLLLLVPGSVSDPAKPPTTAPKASEISSFAQGVADEFASPSATSTDLILSIQRTSELPWLEWEKRAFTLFADMLAVVRERLRLQGRLEATFAAAPRGIALRNPLGELVDCNEAFLSFLGFESKADVPRMLAGIVDQSQTCEPDAAAINAMATTPIDGHELPYLRADGTVVWGRTSVVEMGPATDPLFLAHVDDVTLHRHAMHVITSQASTDSVTGAANRHALNEHLEMLLGGTGKAEDLELPIDEIEGSTCAVLLADLDDFKLVNDAHGHVAGDRLLAEIASRLKAMADDDELVARYGGDEFVLVVSNPASQATVDLRIQELRDCFATPIMLDGTPIELCASIGVALAHENDSPDSLLGRADNAMYAEKFDMRKKLIAAEREPNTPQNVDHSVRVSSPPATTRAAAVDSARELKAALQSGSIVFWGQPIFAIDGLRTLGVELLARWITPEDETILPRNFIGLAEKSGLVVDMGRLALTTAAGLFDEWRSDPILGALGLNVNISPIHLVRGLFDDVNAVARHLPPDSQLGLEFTETSLARGLTTHLTAIQGLSESGVRVIIDDFGIGYSSLSRLQRIPAANLKLDRSFITDIETSARQRTFFTSIASTMRSAGYPVTVEGVETATQLAMVAETAAYSVQGFHMCRPKPMDELADFLREWESRPRPL